jgi:hypothetical protein
MTAPVTHRDAPVHERRDRRDRFALDMHLPPEDGKGRGAYGTRIFRAGGDGDSFALQHELEDAEFDVATSTTQLTVRSSPSTP